MRLFLLFNAPKEFPDFPYDPKLNWTTWTSWDRAGAETVNRAYNYVHVVAAHCCETEPSADCTT